MSQPTPPQISRDVRFDALKGIAIIAVLVHHVTGFGLGSRWHSGSSEMTTEYLNRLVRFAVPTFILLSVYLVGRGIAAKGTVDWRGYLQKRARGTLYPYLVWTVIYLALHATAGRHSSPLAAMGFKSTAPIPFLKTVGWIFGFGKASFHLYFMVALLQVQLLLPALILGGRRILGTSFPKWVLAAVGTQFAIYILSHAIGVYFRSRGQEPPLPPFSSMFYGFLLPTILGMGLAVCFPKRDGEEQLVPIGRWKLALASLAIFVPYVYIDTHPDAVKASVILQSIPNLEEALFMSYSTMVAIALLASCDALKGKPLHWLALIGADSLGIYLMHPIVLEFLRAHTVLLGTLPLPEIWVFLGTLSVTWGVLGLLRLCRLERILFGR